MNKQEIIGFIGQDAEVKDLGSNQVINFSVAVSESYVNKSTNEKVTNTIWYECAKWGNNTVIAQYLKKGTQVYIYGKPNNRAWQKEDGSLVVVNGINVFEIELLGKKDSSEPSIQQPQPVAQQNSTNAQNLNEEHDDLPF